MHTEKFKKVENTTKKSKTYSKDKEATEICEYATEICEYISKLIKDAKSFVKAEGRDDEPSEKLSKKIKYLNEECRFNIEDLDRKKLVEIFQKNFKEDVGLGEEEQLVIKYYCLLDYTETKVIELCPGYFSKKSVVYCYNGNSSKNELGLSQLIRLSMILLDESPDESDVGLEENVNVIDEDEINVIDEDEINVIDEDNKESQTTESSENSDQSKNKRPKTRIPKSQLKSVITAYRNKNQANLALIESVKKRWKSTVNASCNNLRILGVTTHQRDIMRISKWWFPISLEVNDSNKIKVESEPEKIKDIDTLFNGKKRKMLVFGKQGFGKTSLLKLLAMKCCSGEFQSDCLPIFLSMRIIFEKENSFDSSSYLFELIEKLLIEKSINSEEFRQILSEGKVLFLFDAIDVNNRVLTSVKEFVLEFNNNAFIFTSNQELNLHPEFLEYKIDGFDENSRKKFIECWFNSKNSNLSKEDDNSKYVDEFNERLSSEYLKDISKNPLLLQFLCLSEYKNKDIPKSPDNPLIIYRDALFALIRDDDVDNGYDPKDIVYEKLSDSNRINLLAYIAFKMLQNHKSYVSIQTLAEYVREYLRDNHDIEDNLLSGVGEATIRSVEIQDGLLENKQWGEYAFSHTTIQEFFASWYVSQNQFKWKDWKDSGLYEHERLNQVFAKAAQILSINLTEFNQSFNKNSKPEESKK